MREVRGNNSKYALTGLVADFAEHNAQVSNLPEVVDDLLRQPELFPAENALFDKYRHEIAAANVLDIGVGAGRTTIHLLADCRSYHAIDYAPRMIDACRKRFTACPAETFSVGDVRNLSAHATGSYDFVLFSFNGLDYISHEDRSTALREIRRTLRSCGLFLFSTHSLHAFPFPDDEVQARNTHVDPELMARQGWYHLVDYADSVVTYYIYPHVQVRALAEAGFEVLDTLDLQGRPFDYDRPPADWMVHFMCRAV